MKAQDNIEYMIASIQAKVKHPFRQGKIMNVF